MNRNLPTIDGYYLDSGGYIWSLDAGKWRFLGEGNDMQPREPVIKFGPFVRLVPEEDGS